MPVLNEDVEHVDGYSEMKKRPTKGWHRLGTVGVDSGQLLMSDPCYLKSWKDLNCEEHGNVYTAGYNNSDGPFEYNYDGACNATLSYKNAGQLDEGVDAVAWSSGYGDGSYEVWGLYNREGRIVQVTVFMGDKNEMDIPYSINLVGYDIEDDL